jgi:hypothetical protein
MTTLDLSLGLRRIANVIGDELTLRLAEKFGGTENNYIPVHARPDHPWALVIGAEQFAKLCIAFKGRNINLPQAPRGLGDKKKRVYELFERGLSAREIALKAGCSQRYVAKLTRGIARPDMGAPVAAMAGAK